MSSPPMRALPQLHRAVIEWFRDARRELPWRSEHRTPWGVLVSEVMLQQTPVARVLPAYLAWMETWPTPAALAQASPAEVLTAWGRLGYPRRALRLRECAQAIVTVHDGDVPTTEAELRALPGVGEYTAAAVMSFAYQRRAVVVDTNIRRVLARVFGAQALSSPHPTAAERRRAAEVTPSTDDEAAQWAAAVMELGAIVCTARNPQCGSCPITAWCAWRSAGYPADEHADQRRSQRWVGTDRYVRGLIMAALREAGTAVSHSHIAALWPDVTQRDRCVASLAQDGLLVESTDGVSLPRG